MKRKHLLFSILGCALLWTLYAAAAPGPQNHEKVLRSDKVGEVTLTQATMVGNVMLEPDMYVIQHRVAGSQHFIRFMQVKTLHELNITPETTGWYTYTEDNNAGEINCRIAPLGRVAQETLAHVANESGTPRITRVAIKGEGDWHIFQ